MADAIGMSWFSKILFPRANRRDRRRKMVNVTLAAGMIVSGVIAGLLLRASGR